MTEDLAKLLRNKGGGFAVEDQIITKTGEIRDVSIKANLIEVGGKKLLFGVFMEIINVEFLKRTVCRNFYLTR
ncbi:MAG: hypothetical protein N3E52_05960 [Candidatus Bathyarchaeota archaeon]|nr:hypothetical protein [Candidatus Bathyarchaeota archaeon]